MARLQWLALTTVLTASGAPEAPPPALVVLITVDQLRADLLDRYDPVFVGGFRRLRDSGFRFSKSLVDHAITVSHPGHVTIATGKNPSRHGIVDGAWSEWQGNRWALVDPVADSTTKIVGFPKLPGASPRRVLASALPDWFRAANPKARAVAIGLGQYASLLHAGKGRGDVYWFDREAGRFVTSTYYRTNYPAWLDRAQGPLFERLKADSVWLQTTPAGARRLALPDTAPYENDRVHTTFPHRFTAGGRSRLLDWQKGQTPFLDGTTLELAQAAVQARALGRRESTDYLNIVLSQADEIGHSFGPRSQEQLDYLVRLDGYLAKFFDFLDRTVGPGRYLVALTADHGVADPPEAVGAAGRRLGWGEVEALFTEIAATATPQGRRYDSATANRVATIVRKHDFVADAMTLEQLSGPVSADSFVALYQRSYRPGRIMRLPLFSPERGVTLGDYGVVARLTEGTVLDLDPGVHLSPYQYDRSVPLIFMGAGIPPGWSDAPARTVDVAPTLASLARVRAPADLDGRILPVHR